MEKENELGLINQIDKEIRESDAFTVLNGDNYIQDSFIENGSIFGVRENSVELTAKELKIFGRSIESLILEVLRNELKTGGILSNHKK